MITKTNTTARKFVRPNAAEIAETRKIKAGILAAGWTEICGILSDDPAEGGIKFVKYIGGEQNWKRGDATEEFTWNKATDAKAREIAGLVAAPSL